MDPFGDMDLTYRKNQKKSHQRKKTPSDIEELVDDQSLTDIACQRQQHIAEMRQERQKEDHRIAHGIEVTLLPVEDCAAYEGQDAYHNIKRQYHLCIHHLQIIEEDLLLHRLGKIVTLEIVALEFLQKELLLQRLNALDKD